MVGTDFNEGVYGIGPKKGLKAVKEGKVDELEVDFDFDEVRKVFLEHPTVTDYNVNFNSVNADGLTELLHNQHGFSADRVKRAVNELEKAYKENTQQTLDNWF